jgi:hypothetical protein
MPQNRLGYMLKNGKKSFIFLIETVPKKFEKML